MHPRNEEDNVAKGTAFTEGLTRTLRRAYRRRGFERETLVFVVKSALASVIAFAAGVLMGEESQLGFAIFAALLVVRPTVYGSVLRSGRYVVAVFLGALLAGVVGLTVGPHLWSFALAIVVALLVGQVRYLGGQGSQLPVIAGFALASGSATNLDELGSLLLMVCVGSASALLVNFLLAPAIRFRDAENAVLDFADGLSTLSGDIAEGLRDGEEGLDLDRWGQASERLEGTVRNALETVSRQEDRFRLNPRRLVTRRAIPVEQLRIYRSWVHALNRASQHMWSFVQTLRTALDSGTRSPSPDDAFLQGLAPLMEHVSEAFALVRDAKEPENHLPSDDLRTLVREALDKVVEQREGMHRSWDDERWPVYGALLTDTERLLEEIDQGRENSDRAGTG